MDYNHTLATEPVLPQEGWHSLHLLFRVDRARWGALSRLEQIAAKKALTQWVQEIRAEPGIQLHPFSMVGLKADLGFMLMGADLQVLDRFSKLLSRSLGGALISVLSGLSLTERSEYTTTEAEFAASFSEESGLSPESSEFAVKIEEFRKRMTKYAQDRLYPQLADWPVICFYPMSKRRNPGQNWYALDFAMRKKLMAGHARVGRKYAGRVRQLITGSTGLDDGEWWVTLFAHSTSDIKDIVYEMRFDPVSAEYAEFGEFFIGLQLPLSEIFQRLDL